MVRDVRLPFAASFPLFLNAQMRKVLVLEGSYERPGSPTHARAHSHHATKMSPAPWQVIDRPCLAFLRLRPLSPLEVDHCSFHFLLFPFLTPLISVASFSRFCVLVRSSIALLAAMRGLSSMLALWPGDLLLCRSCPFGP